MPASIQELLETAGYKENPKTQQFDRDDQHIPYADVCGTVTQFREKARKHDWLIPAVKEPVVRWPFGL